LARIGLITGYRGNDLLVINAAIDEGPFLPTGKDSHLLKDLNLCHVVLLLRIKA